MACDCGKNNGEKEIESIRQTRPMTSIVSSDPNEEKKELEKKELYKEVLPRRIIKFM